MGWVRMKIHGMKSLCFKLKWETFVGHCFGFGEWGKFMANVIVIALKYRGS